MLKNFALVCVFIALPSLVLAEEITIDLRKPPHNVFTNIVGSTVHNDVMVRTGTGSSVAGQYRGSRGLGSLPIGTVVTVTYPDGTSEQFMIVGLTGSVQAKPIAGTQKDANGNPIACEGCQTLEELQTEAEGNRGGRVGEGNEGGGIFSGISNAWNNLLIWLGIRDKPGTVTVGPIEPVNPGSK